MKNTRTLWLIPARSGSKGIPHKNILELGGKPLLAWRIESTLPLVAEGDALWISTDNAEYARIGKNFGAEAPFLRPPALSSDTATSASACLHAMSFANERGLHFDYIGLLQPTSPFVKSQSLERALNGFIHDSESLAAIAVRKVDTPSLFIQPRTRYLDILARRFTQLKGTRRQDMSEEITPCGGFFISKWDHFIKNGTFYTKKTLPILVDGAEAIDIDTEEDFSFAQYLVETMRVLK